ncbi:MAG TPA: NAD(P)H-dependent oxidoreductase [Aquabacterium sp.]|uniref:NADPH-dependent FMN reductase n=1 Tax=Aquabacterium sp. TaxID=1872578 RepID=UPI002E321EBB|nr:NAD(P)H-dependent oxidoreductase [Aquabacterium sp.]HEX5354582.1 NAD(P)H-dependent oxidoreductase [Aquabacterium sp.]
MTASITPRPVRLLAISGSARQGSLNRQLVDLAARKAEAAGAQVTHVDLRELAMPIYDDDWAAAHGRPAGALKLRELFASHDGLLIACPEYNALPTPLLINSFDWLSTVQAQGDLPSGTGATAGKPVGLLAASPGALGGIRALPIVRTYLSTNFAMVVVPEQMGLPLADQQLDASSGEVVLKKPELDHLLDKVVASVMRQAAWRLTTA